MSSLVRTLACTVLALAAGMASFASVADEQTARYPQWAEAAVRQAEEAQGRQREARLRWEYERRRSAAHARMPNTLYASTPSAQAHTDLSCPALVDEDTRRIYRRFLDRRDGGQTVLGAPGLARASASSQSGIMVFPANRRSTSASSSRPSSAKTKDDAGGHLIQASGWTTAQYQSKSTTEGSQQVYLFPSASEPLREGFVRVINHSTEAGEVTIDPVDDSGREFDTITLSIDDSETVHFNSGDLETGNEGKGLSGSTGSGQGDWRLAFSSDLDIEALSYIRTEDGFLTAMHDVAPVDGNVHRVAIVNPGSNRNQVSRLRLINPTDATAEVTIRGTDDKGMPGSGEVSLSLDAGTTREITAEQLESGGTGLAGMLGDGSGKWRLQVESEQAVVAMSLLESPTDHLTNLSTVPELAEDGVHGVPLFPAAGDDSGRQGFVRAINRSDTAGEIHIKAYDETERDYEAVVLTIGGNEVVHFNSDDLEQGSPQKGLSGGTGAGEGDWRLELTSDLEIEVLSYIRTTDGFLTAMHDVAPSAGTRHRVAVFNPGSNRNQESLLRLINPADETAEVTITGVDDKGAAGTSAVGVSLVGGSSRTVGAWDLESGAEGLDGALGDGAGKWQLMIESDRPVVAMSLLRSPTGHLTNLSTAPVRGARGGAVQEPQTAEAVFRQLILGPIVQSKCITCHVEGGASGNTRLVFVTDANPDHEAINLQVFEDFLDEVQDGASYILNKIQGALGHGGGIQVAAGTDEYADMERFLALLGEDVSPVSITPATVFDGVKMESARSTLRRAAIIFAGRIPTDEEYESIKTGGFASMRTAIRDLMEGPKFHEFLIRASNDRLLTDRLLPPRHTIENSGYFVDFDNEFYRQYAAANESGEGEAAYQWEHTVQYGAGRAPLELIAHVVENDLRYTEILTADYIMANPSTAEAYGATTAFDDPDDVHEFKPSEIVNYYRIGPGHESEFTPGVGLRVSDPGPLRTRWPHAGILNTKVFLKRYPTTATNRNRARSRWTYYHFLDIDIEKSASRTTDPVALADTNNPTMNNPACTVCHTAMDPVAGAFQNYGDVGFYRDKWGGMDSLDDFYKKPDGQSVLAIEAGTYDGRQTLSFQLRLTRHGRVFLRSTNYRQDQNTGAERHARLDRIVLRGVDSGKPVYSAEFEDMDLVGQSCSNIDDAAEPGDHIMLWGNCLLVLPFEIPSDGRYEMDVVAWADQLGNELSMLEAGQLLYRERDAWYRDMPLPGFDGEFAPNPENSLQWLAGKIVADDRFGEATVAFWWPSIMGGEVAEPPEDEGDADFDGLLLTSNAQAAEVTRLARGFRRGFGNGAPYNLRDLLVEIVLSKWFRADWFAGDDPVRAVALRDAGAARLLTPEELARKTAALTGFQWGRWYNETSPPSEQRLSRLTDRNEYRLLYGGIDSDGITERARDLTSVMAGVAKSHAMESSCPVVLREFYLLPEEDRRLFTAIDTVVSPVWEDVGGTFATTEDWGTVTLDATLTAGEKTVRLRQQHGNVLVDEIVVRNAAKAIVDRFEFEQVSETECGQPWPEIEPGYFAFWCGSLAAIVDIPATGEYMIEVAVKGEPQGDGTPELTIAVEWGDISNSKGAAAIKAKLVELHERLLGVEVRPDSPDVEAVYGLFVDVWERKRQSEDDWFFDVHCLFDSDYRYFDGIFEGAFNQQENDAGVFYGYDYDRVWRFLHEEINPRDPEGVARTWVVVLASLLMDYRYLHL